MCVCVSIRTCMLACVCLCFCVKARKQPLDVIPYWPGICQQVSSIPLPVLGLSTCPDAGLCSYKGSGTSDYSCKHVSFWAIISPAPENIFHFHRGAVTRLQTLPCPPCEDGDRGILPAAPLSLSAPAHLQELSKAPSTKCMAERSEWDFALPGFPFRNGEEIWLVRRTEPVLRELVSSGRREWELWRVPLTFPATVGAKCAFLFLFVRDWRPAPCFLWSTDLENIDLHGIPEALVRLMWFS